METNSKILSAQMKKCRGCSWFWEVEDLSCVNCGRSKPKQEIISSQRLFFLTLSIIVILVIFTPPVWVNILFTIISGILLVLFVRAKVALLFATSSFNSQLSLTSASSPKFSRSTNLVNEEQKLCAVLQIIQAKVERIHKISELSGQEVAEGIRAGIEMLRRQAADIEKVLLKVWLLRLRNYLRAIQTGSLLENKEFKIEEQLVKLRKDVDKRRSWDRDKTGFTWEATFLEVRARYDPLAWAKINAAEQMQDELDEVKQIISLLLQYRTQIKLTKELQEIKDENFNHIVAKESLLLSNYPSNAIDEILFETARLEAIIQVKEGER